MKLETYYQTIDELTSRKSTGSPAELAEKLGVSVSYAKRIIGRMRLIYNVPIKFSKQRNSYVYLQEGSFYIGFIFSNREQAFEDIQEVIKKYLN